MFVKLLQVVISYIFQNAFWLTPLETTKQTQKVIFLNWVYVLYGGLSL